MKQVLRGETPSEEEVFYKDWCRETQKENIGVQNETFRLFITLDTALLSLYLGFFERISISCTLLKLASPALIIGSLISAILGIFPFGVTVNPYVPAEIKDYKKARERYKGFWLAVSAVLLVAGLIALLIARALG